jgi:predicted metallo-beta-lactamase superfamily hydrolase
MTNPSNGSIKPYPHQKGREMPPAVKVTPLAYESLGVRGMCTLIETKDVGILADAGVAMGPRFRLMPHPVEYKARARARERIEAAAGTAKVTTISHYHNDHHTPNFEDPVWLGSTAENAERIYRNKIILTKDFRSKINVAQRRRGWLFKQSVEELAKEFEIADGQTYTYGRTTVQFSQPVPHGESDSELGWVIPLSIESKGEKVLFAPDVQGPVVEETVELILKEKPDIAIIGGPPTYLQGFKVSDEFINAARHNMKRIAERTPIFVVDHHLLRDPLWANFLDPVRETAAKFGNKVITAAELIGESPTPLEGERRKLYADEPPSNEFWKWAKLPKEKQRGVPPPL